VMRLVLCAVAFLAIILPAPTIAGSGASLPDPNYLDPVPTQNGPVNRQSTVKTPRSVQTVNPAVRNLVIIAAGQSNIVNIAPSLYTPTNPSALDNMNVYDGAIYAAVDPLIGTSDQLSPSAGHPILRLADNLVTANLFDRVIIQPIGIGGTLIADWQTGFASNRIRAALNRLKARGIVAGTNVTIIIIWGQGESDALAGVSQAAYTAGLTAVIADSRAAGFTGTWFVAKQTWQNGVASTAIQNGQLAVINHGAGIWEGPNADALVGNACPGSSACRVADNIHWTDIGSAAYASAWQTALHAFGAPF